MTIAQFALSEANIGQVVTGGSGKKPPPKRTSVALSDRNLVPEPR